MGQGPVQVQATVGSSSNDRHGGVAVWVEILTNHRFKACVLRNGEHVNNTVHVNWFATQSIPPGVLKGSLAFSLFSSGTRCKKITFNNILSQKPKVFVTAHHQTPGRVQDAMTIWVDDVKKSDFTVCMREMRAFSGAHFNIVVDWLAFLHKPVTLNVTEAGKNFMRNNKQPKRENNFAFCQRQNFSQPHYSAPVVIATVGHPPSNDPNSVMSKYNAFNIWAENITTTGFSICIKDLVSYDEKHDSVNVHYMVIGDLDPCINVTCDYHAVCQAFGSYDERYVCVTDCPSTVQTVCASNGQTFDNKCLMELEICQNRRNYTYYHPGSCTGFPVLKGHHEILHVPKWADSKCDVIQLKPFTFYPHKKVHIQVTVNYVNDTSLNNVHDAVAYWVEDVSDQNFTVCVQVTGRNSRPEEPLAAIDWLAYQGSPVGGVVGIENMDSWWTGTRCKTVNLPQNTFSNAPTVLLTAEHEREGIKYDAAAVWAEDITKNNFKACARELQSFDGLHRDIELNWLAFEELENPLFNEHGSVSFHFTTPVSSNQISSAECKTIAFSGMYNDLPTVQITASHSTSGGNNVQPESNGIATWIESMNLTHFKVSAVEYHVKKYDRVIVQYTIIADACPGDWRYFRGFCYLTESTCTGWSNASTLCKTKGADLVSIKDQEENVYIQHLHGGDKTWIGLTDIATEGTFVWSDKHKYQFRYWAPGQPNDYGGSDCVHTLGIGHHYQWNDVPCTKCLPFTCKKDKDECLTNKCLNGGTCNNLTGNYSCTCASGYTGRHCQIDIDECSSSPCQNGGTCIDKVNGYNCTCKSPYSGKHCARKQNDICGDILHHDPNLKSMRTNYPVPSGWTLCFIDETDTAYHNTPCRDLLVNLKNGAYTGYADLLNAGGNFGCWHGSSGQKEGSSYSDNRSVQKACRNNVQQTTRLSAWNVLTTTLTVCIKM